MIKFSINTLKNSLRFKQSVCLFLLSISYLHPAIASTSSVEICSNFPQYEPINGPLAVINCEFHRVYENRIQSIVKTFGALKGRPVILNLGGQLLFKYNGQTEQVNVNPIVYQQIKSFGHAAFSVYLILSKTTPGQLTIETREALLKLEKNIKQAALTIPTLNFSKKAKMAAEKTSQITNNFIADILAQNHFSAHELKRYFAKVHPLLLDAINEAAKIELNLLNVTVNRWLKMLTAQEKEKLSIVVATSHQARAEEISLQYFANKFNFRFGQGALNEKNFVVLEGKFDEASALALLARHYLDRQVAQTILHDPARLQYDLLGDSAKKLLAK